MDRLRLGFERTPVKVAIFTIAIGIFLTPIMAVLVPPLIDYPNHLAKAHLAASLPENAYLAAFYEWRLRLVPNLAQDIVILPLAKLFGVYAAGRIFLAWSLVQIFLGVCLLRYALHGKVGYLPLLAIVFLYNKVVWWGFLNYLFASGLILIFFAVWILMERWSPTHRSAVFALVMSMMFFFHLIAAALLCICIVSYEVSRVWLERERGVSLIGQWPSFLKAGVITVAPFTMVPILWSISPSGGIENIVERDGFMTLFDAIFSAFVFRGTEVEFWLAICVAMLTIGALLLRQAVLAPRMILPIVLLLIIALLMPATFKGVYGTHYRIPYILGCILVAGIVVRGSMRPFSMLAMSAIAALFITRIVYTTAEWRAFDSQIQEYRSAIARIQPGSMVVTSVDHRDVNAWERKTLAGNVFWHLSALAVVDASAFDPLLFSNPIRQSVSVRGSGERVDVPVGLPAPTQWMSEKFNEGTLKGHSSEAGRWPSDYRLQWRNWYHDFEYVIRFSVANVREELDGPVTLVESGKWFDLYKIDKPGMPKADLGH